MYHASKTRFIHLYSQVCCENSKAPDAVSFSIVSHRTSPPLPVVLQRHHGVCRQVAQAVQHALRALDFPERDDADGCRQGSIRSQARCRDDQRSFFLGGAPLNPPWVCECVSTHSLCVVHPIVEGPQLCRTLMHVQHSLRRPHVFRRILSKALPPAPSKGPHCIASYC